MGITVLIGIWAVPAWSAHLEIGPTGGYRFGGTVNDVQGQSRTVEPAESWGVVADVYFSDSGAMELLWTRQETDVSTGEISRAKIPLTVDHYQFGGLKDYGDDRFRPFLAGLLGWSHVKSSGKSLDRFSVTMGGGAKYYVSPRIGVRADLRAHVVVGDGTVSASVGSAGGTVSFAGDAFLQGDVSAGVFLRLGGETDSPPRPTGRRSLRD